SIPEFIPEMNTGCNLLNKKWGIAQSAIPDNVADKDAGIQAKGNSPVSSCLLPRRLLSKEWIMIKKISVRKDQLALLSRNGDYYKVLPAGEHLLP
ncbi:hypothetical protein OEZ66_32835, partial [Escherichia coli]|nr:hypothetical protein [Escherichia coli]